MVAERLRTSWADDQFIVSNVKSPAGQGATFVVESCLTVHLFRCKVNSQSNRLDEVATTAFRSNRLLRAPEREESGGCRCQERRVCTGKSWRDDRHGVDRGVDMLSNVEPYPAGSDHNKVWTVDFSHHKTDLQVRKYSKKSL